MLQLPYMLDLHAHVPHSTHTEATPTLMHRSRRCFELMMLAAQGMSSLGQEDQVELKRDISGRIANCVHPIMPCSPFVLDGTL